MTVSYSFQRNSRRNSQPKVARVPTSVLLSEAQSKISQQETKFFVLRAKDKELMLKMYDTSTKALTMLATLKSKEQK